ncbi:MAG: lysophospholipid acyltransferase family protein [Victivallales bacterium]|nr:lysophospholipid acyltransferase family protein [Victivallales bacterium]
MPTWLAWLLSVIVKMYAWTFRVTVDDPDGWLTSLSPFPVIITLWHNRILFLASLVPKTLRTRSTVLISNSRDGEYVSAFIRFFGLAVVRGSSSKGGVHALIKLAEAVKEGRSTILTIDGPRGPKYTVHKGPAALARLGHVPIVPLGLDAAKYWSLHSWDNTQIPKPFSRVTVRVGKPYSLPERIEMLEACEIIRERQFEITKD